MYSDRVDVQDAFVNSLAKHLKVEPKTPLRAASRLTKVLRRFSNIASSREIGVLEFEEIGELVDNLLSRVWRTL